MFSWCCYLSSSGDISVYYISIGFDESYCLKKSRQLPNEKTYCLGYWLAEISQGRGNIVQ